MSLMQKRTRKSEIDGSIGQKLRLRRKVRGLSLAVVAQNSGVSIGQLSHIERGISAPSLHSLKQICEALDMPMGWLFDGKEADEKNDSDYIVRTANRRILDLGEKGMTKELMTPDSCPGIQMMLIIIQPQGGSGKEPYNNPDGAKCGTVVSGTLGLEIDGKQFELMPGDAFAFDARQLCRFWAIGEEVCQVIWTVTPAVY